ncbi:MAG: hypothetical protein AAB582_02185 [Patescibacteria group bacterium]
MALAPRRLFIENYSGEGYELQVPITRHHRSSERRWLYWLAIEGDQGLIGLARALSSRSTRRGEWRLIERYIAPARKIRTRLYLFSDYSRVNRGARTRP